ncbi:MAG: PfkB family carbohydrate kinase [Opitutaceae bacterium]
MASFTTGRAAPIYLYGMIVYSTIHRLGGDYPEADGYAEIAETHRVPGGETGNAALVLARWGHRVKVGGPFLGRETRDGVAPFLGRRGIDCSGLHYDEGFEGVCDLVLVGGTTRTVFGAFGRYFRGPRRWSPPDEGAIAAADIVGVDPFFGAESGRAAEICAEMGKPWVTIDCPPDSPLHRQSAATIVSGEYLRGEFPGQDARQVLRRYSAAGRGLVVLTSGAREILYARGDGEVRSQAPYPVAVKSTLGAGDTFRAGVIHGIISGMDDTQTVQFAAATAAMVCTRFPMALDPPGLDDIAALIAGRQP